MLVIGNNRPLTPATLTEPKQKILEDSMHSSEVMWYTAAESRY